MASLMYALAPFAASVSVAPFAIIAAKADDMVQPVPWVLRVSTLVAGSGVIISVVAS